MSQNWFVGAVVSGSIWVALAGAACGEEPQHRAAWMLFPNRHLESEAVKKELRLSLDQRQKLAALTQEFDAAALRAIAAPDSPNPDEKGITEQERIKRFRQANVRSAERLKPLLPKFSEKFAKILSQGQLLRLQQITWQLEGLTAYRDPKVAELIGLSPEQRKRLETIWQVYVEQTDRLVYSDSARIGSPDVQKTVAKMEQVHKEAMTKMAAVVTAKQHAEFERLKGKPFDSGQADRQSRPTAPR